MTDVVTYARVSSTDQAEEGFSIPAQRQLLHSYAAREKMTIVVEFSDDETAKSVGRTGFGQMLAFLKANPQIETLLVEKVDRLVRNYDDFQTLKKMGTSIHFVKEGTVLHPQAHSSVRFFTGMRVLMAEHYVDNLSEEVKKGMRRKCEEGGWPTWAPLGYINVKDPAERKRTGGIVLDPLTAPVVREMFEAAATGRHSLASISALARHHGIRGRWGGHIGKQHVSNILRCRAYYGETEWGKVIYKGKYETLITREIYDRVQRAMKEQSRPKTGTHAFAFGGMIRCGEPECGGVLTGDRKKGKYVYYSCRCSRRNHRYYPEAMFDRALSELLQSMQLPAEDQDRLVQRIDAWFGDEARKESLRVTRVRTRLGEIDSFALHAYEDKVMGKMSEADWRARSDHWRAEAERLAGELESLQPRIEREELLRRARAPFELLQTVATEYLRRDPVERGSVVKTCCSNLLMINGSVSINLRSPYHIIAKMSSGPGWLTTVDEFRTAIIVAAVA